MEKVKALVDEMYRNQWFDRSAVDAEIKAAEEAIEKQTSKKVIEPSEDVDGDIKHYTCPVCKVRHHDYLGRYCEYCGQRLERVI